MKRIGFWSIVAGALIVAVMFAWALYATGWF